MDLLVLHKIIFSKNPCFGKIFQPKIFISKIKII
nr:MAG TPA: hypothetical protein [Caudoviricetes sp.]